MPMGKCDFFYLYTTHRSLATCDNEYLFFSEVTTLGMVEGDVSWQYLLHQHDLRNLHRWVDQELFSKEDGTVRGDSREIPLEESAWLDTAYMAPLKPGTWMEGGHNDSSGRGGVMFIPATEAHCSAFNLLSEPLYSSDMDSSARSHDSLDSASVVGNEGDTWSVQSFEQHDRREALWPLEQLWPITQVMVDQLYDGSPFTETLLNVLAQHGIFCSQEQQSPVRLVGRLLVSRALHSLERLETPHPCQIPDREIHQVVLRHLVSEDLRLPTFDFMRVTVTEMADGPTWAMTLKPFMNLVETRDRQAVFNACLNSLQVLVEHCHSPQELVFPAFLTMLYSPQNTLRDLFALKMGKEVSVQGEVNIQEGESKMVDDQLCGLLSCCSLMPQQILESLLEIFPYLQKLFPTQKSDTALDVTVYDLLSGPVPFDITRLFTFQQLNRWVFSSTYLLFLLFFYQSVYGMVKVLNSYIQDDT